MVHFAFCFRNFSSVFWKRFWHYKYGNCYVFNSGKTSSGSNALILKSHKPGPSHGTAVLSLKELRYRSCILKKLAKLFKIVISNPFQSSPSSVILFPFCHRITPLVFSFLATHYFQVLQHFNRDLGRQRNDSKYRDVAPLTLYVMILTQCVFTWKYMVSSFEVLERK